MAYSLDLRQRVVDFINQGGSKRDAAKIYQVCETTIYAWLKRDDLRPTKVLRRRRKLDWEALAHHSRSTVSRCSTPGESSTFWR